MTGAKVAGLVGTGAPLDGVEVLWVDMSPAGDGSQRVENGVISSALTGIATRPIVNVRDRYFGRGDVLRDARLHFDSGAKVEIDSLFQNCTIQIGDDTEVIVGESGVLADCEIVGAGIVTVHGKFFERKSPGIVGLRQLSVSNHGVVVAAVSQNSDLTRFAFEAGCQLRVKIIPAGAKTKNEVKR